MSEEPYKSYSEIHSDIETYGDSTGTLGNMPTIFKSGVAISSINPAEVIKKYNYSSVKIITNDLIQKINWLKTGYTNSCANGVNAIKCQKKTRACDALLSELNRVSDKLSRNSLGGSRRKTMKGRRKQNKSRRNRKSRR